MGHTSESAQFTARLRPLDFDGTSLQLFFLENKTFLVTICLFKDDESSGRLKAFG